MYPTTRREFLLQGAAAVGTAALGTQLLARAAQAKDTEPLYEISVAEWSLHRTIFAKKLDNLDFAPFIKKNFNIDAVELVNQFFADKAKDRKYLRELKSRADDAGVKILLIMIDREGALGDPDPKRRKQAVENHYKWVEAAKFLGGHSIRVNARSRGSYQEQQKLAADGLQRLCEFAAPLEMNVIVENHGGLSSNGKWLAGVIQRVNMPNCGTLPDFGNFRLSKDKWYDRYQGVKELMPYAKAVSAKSHDFDQQGNEIHTDYRRMMKIVVDAGYHGYVGIEYEGRRLPEVEGIRATQRLLLRVREELQRGG